MKKRFMRAVVRLFLTSFACCATCVCACWRANAAEDWTVEKAITLHEQLWATARGMRVEFERKVRTLNASDSYDGCVWEASGDRMRVVESIVESTDATKKDANALVRVRSECVYDGEKTYELDEPFELFPITKVELADYAKLRRQGVRAMISNRNKHWRFFFFSPTPRYFSIPSEPELLTLKEASEKYPTRVHKVLTNDSGDQIVVLEIHEDEVQGDASAVFGSWRLYVSLNMKYQGAISAYQFVVETNREPKTKVITECKVDSFRETRGIWTPASLEYREHAGQRSCITKINVKSVFFDMPEDSIGNFVFPENMIVTESTWIDGSTKPERKVHIWGDNNEPARTFESQEKFDEFYKSEYPNAEKLAREEAESRSIKAFVFLAICVLVVIALAFSLHDGDKARARSLAADFDEELETSKDES